MMELLLVIALTFTIGVVVFPMSLSFYRAEMLDGITEGVTSALRTAHSMAVTGRDDTSHGVKIMDDAYVTFAGDSYASRDVTHDEVFSLPVTVQFTGPDEIVFALRTGTPSEAGTLIFSVDTQTRQVIVSSHALITTE